MILSFADPDTEAMSKGKRIPHFLRIQAIARRKLAQLQIATRLEDLRVPPGNKLRPLSADRLGLYGIQVEEKLYLRFFWTQQGAEEVQLAYLDEVRS